MKLELPGGVSIIFALFFLLRTRRCVHQMPMREQEGLGFMVWVEGLGFGVWSLEFGV